VIFTTTGALPTGLSVNTQYWVKYIDADTFNVATTMQGTAINTSGSQSGTHTAYTAAQRQTAVTLQDGRYCKSGDKTRLYLGTFHASGATTTEDTIGGTTGGRRYLWNYYNRVPRPMLVYDNTSSWSYATATVRVANNSLNNTCIGIVGIREDAISAHLTGAAFLSSNSTRTARIGIAINSGTAFGTFIGLGYNSTATNGWYPMGVQLNDMPLLGYNLWAWLESGSDGSCSFAGTNGGTSMAGMTVNWWG
jgi:hypothetical protein